MLNLDGIGHQTRPCPGLKNMILFILLHEHFLQRIERNCGLQLVFVYLRNKLGKFFAKQNKGIIKLLS